MFIVFKTVFKKKGKNNKKTKKQIEDDYQEYKTGLDGGIKKGILIVFIIAFATISLLSLFSIAGALGLIISKILTSAFGWGRWLFPFVLFFFGYSLYKDNEQNTSKSTNFGIFIFTLSLHAILHLFIPTTEWEEAIVYGSGGGYLGYLIALGFYKAVDIIASWVLLLSIFLISLMIIFQKPLQSFVGEKSPLAILFAPFKFIHSKLFGDKFAEEHEEIENDEITQEILSMNEEEIEHINTKKTKNSLDSRFSSKPVNTEDNLKAKNNHLTKASLIEEPVDFDISLNSSKVKIDLPINLLKAGASKPTSGDIKANIGTITKTLENFGIKIEMDGVTVGPTITQYAFKPADGVKLSRITALRNDLALALAAHPIRIEAPIPGKSLVGVEIPNLKKALVSLKEILIDQSFKKSESNLTIGLGKDVAGKVWVDNLAKMPHVIVAGATNSGKSVCLNTIIISLLYRNNPDELRFIMVDPKRVELTVYNNIPHLLTPVITDVTKTLNALKWCLNEMDRRFEILSKKGKRNIQSFNENQKSSDEKMPYIIFVIDELADLMVASKRDVESAIIRLAQMARAVGIHLILATQRPSTDVITGLIKANTPARIAFAVASGIDSRTIIDAIGAEDLLGQGDMLISTPSISQPKRLQGAYLSDIEIKRIVRYIKEQVNFETNFIDEIVENQQVQGVGAMGANSISNNSDKDDGGDALFNEAKELVISAGKASASLLQRRLSVGYARAARIMDLLEEAGAIGPANGSKPRQILMSQTDIASQDNTPTSFTPLHNPEESEAPDHYLDNTFDNEEEINEEPTISTPEDNNEDIGVKVNNYVTPESNPDKSFGEEEEEEEEEEDNNNKKTKENKNTDDDLELEDDGKYFSK